MVLQRPMTFDWFTCSERHGSTPGQHSRATLQLLITNKGSSSWKHDRHQKTARSGIVQLNVERQLHTSRCFVNRHQSLVPNYS